MNIGQVSRAASGSLRERWGIATFAGGLVIISGFVASGVFAGCQRVEAQQESKPAFVATGAKSSPSPSPTAAKNDKEIVVYVTGAVKRPGVYTLPANARLYHAIRAAGGFKANAITDSLNLADIAMDGDQISVPARKTKIATEAPRPVIVRKAAPVVVTLPGGAESGHIVKSEIPKGRVLGEPEPRLVEPSVPTLAPPTSRPAYEMPEPGYLAPLPDPNAPVTIAKSEAPRTSGRSVRITGTKSPRSPAAKPTKFKNPGDGVVRLNSATAAELEQLPRCGAAMSAKIIAYRQQHGGFSTTKQLLDVPGVGDKTYEKWEPFLAL